VLATSLLARFIAVMPTMGDIRHFNFRDWNHRRLAARDRARGPLTPKQQRKLCRSLGTLTARGVVVNDPEYRTRLDSIRSAA
jgi:hypothetical protein